ncbi:hypothetical protein [Bradyrhizobium prioriisuperbiae]|uniref:hypothetical protein n=1 Tax=Bradyrhizobium prioriisuperbiae TaxID=2854389 RepID=UPI0028E22187|nr:hypothetical protein [Bradyrhizobium prioritasuperba]
MDAYDLIRSAVLDHRCLTATYRRRVRHFSPHCLGRNKDGGFSVLGFQYAGQSSTVLPAGGEWRCFAVSELTGIHINNDPWRTGSHAGSRSGCVKLVDVDAYLDSGSGDRRRR